MFVNSLKMKALREAFIWSPLSSLSALRISTQKERHFDDLNVLKSRSALLLKKKQNCSSHRRNRARAKFTY